MGYSYQAKYAYYWIKSNNIGLMFNINVKR